MHQCREMRTLLFAVMLFAGAACAAPRPNVVLVIADDFGYGDLSCQGQVHFRTPRLDRMAAEGVRFTRHYSGATVCAPSRCSLMTGMDGGHASIRGNGPFALRPDPQDLTVATLLKRAGYATALIGKSCVTGNTQTPGTLGEKGFDYFYGTTDHKDGHFRYPPFVYENLKKIEFPGNRRTTGTHHDAVLYRSRALEWLARQGERPFFLVLSLPLPHAALAAPEATLARVRAGIRGEVSQNDASQHYGAVKEVKASYAAMVTEVDDTVGAVLDALRDRGLDRDTLVLFTSDNGPHAEGGYHPSMLGSSGGLRGHKRDLYEGGIRVPMIARWPAGCPGGRTSAHVSAFWDFLPTLCELAGVEAPAGIQGISYVPVLAGREETQRRHDSLYWEFHEMGNRRALMEGDWKLVQYGLNPGAMGRPELYHLGDDPKEASDVAARHPRRVEEMLGRMGRARVANERFPLKALDEAGR